MPSDLKSETSRINGAKSHGPKTPEGKETSSRNSLKHGFTSRKTLILQTESPDDYQEFLAEHIAIHQPVTAPESELVDQMAIARWRIRRFVAAETVLIDCEMVRNREKVDKEFGPTDSVVHLAQAIRSLADESRCLSLMSRYESRLQRAHDKAYAALRELQHLRTPPLLESEPQPTPSPTPPDSAPSSAQSDPATTSTPSVSAGAGPSVHNPSVSAGASFDAPEILRNEPTTPAPQTPLRAPVGQVPDVPSPPQTEISEDHDK